jgi:DNA-binding CsgD family transcriptional regulator
MLDQIDQGLLLVRPDGEVLYANPAALQALDSRHPLLHLGHSLHLHDARDVAPLLDALADAARGARRLVNLGHGSETLAISVVPLAGPRRPDALAHLQDHPGILLVLGRRAEGAPPGLAAFAHSLGFTPTETKVLQGLYEGLRPTELGQRMGVAVSTIRTHIGSMRDKSGAGSIRELVRRVAVLPPVELDAPAPTGAASHDSSARRREQPLQPTQQPPAAPASPAT